MLLRVEMYKTMKYVEEYFQAHPEIKFIDSKALDPITETPRQKKALNKLISAGCLKDVSFDHDNSAIMLLAPGSLYRLDRFELWFNRFISFAIGVASTLILQAILRLMP